MLFGARWRRSREESSFSRSAKVLDKSESARASMERTGRSASSRGSGSYVPVTMTDSRLGLSSGRSDWAQIGDTDSRAHNQRMRFKRYQLRGEGIILVDADCLDFAAG